MGEYYEPRLMMDERHHLLCDECGKLRQQNLQLLELAREVAKDYPDAAEWKDARGRLLAMASQFVPYDPDDDDE
jgi:hypothetical protein